MVVVEGAEEVLEEALVADSEEAAEEGVVEDDPEVVDEAAGVEAEIAEAAGMQGAESEHAVDNIANSTVSE